MKTLGDLVKFILNNRIGNAFKGCSEYEIATAITFGILDNTMLYSVDNEDNLNGVIICKEEPESKVMFVVDILTTNTGVIKSFVRIFKQRYPEHKLSAMRKGKHIIYSTDKLCSKLMKGKE